MNAAVTHIHREFIIHRSSFIIPPTASSISRAWSPGLSFVRTILPASSMAMAALRSARRADGGIGGGLDLFEPPLLLRADLFLGLVEHRAAEFFGVAASLLEDGADFVARGGQLAIVVGQKLLGLLVGGLGLGDLLGDVVLPFIEPFGDWLPGELPQDRQQTEEDDRRP